MRDEKQIKGGAKLDRALGELTNPRQQRAVVRSALNFAATPIVQTARLNAPRGKAAHTTYKGRLVAPGFTSRSVKKVTKIVGNNIVTMIGVKKEAFYSLLFLEQGTKFISADPWLEPALRSNFSKVVDRYGSKILDRIRKVAAKNRSG